MNIPTCVPSKWFMPSACASAAFKRRIRSTSVCQMEWLPSPADGLIDKTDYASPCKVSQPSPVQIFCSAGALDYVNFLRATQRCTNDVREKARAFERAVFNVAFHNRDDHPKNFAYTMSRAGDWKLAPAYDVTFCEGPGGYHQMDVMGEALESTERPCLDWQKKRRLEPMRQELSLSAFATYPTNSRLWQMIFILA